MTALTFDHLTFAWPDGSLALDDVSATFGHRRTGLVGRNGTGKTTLLRLVAGELTPTAGSITTGGDVAYLPQRLTLDTGTRVAELLGVSTALEAVRAITAGDVDPARFDDVGDDWDVEARCRAALSESGLKPETLDHEVGTLSGGEAMVVALVGIRLRGASLTLLDEPTNNLDRDARHMVYDLVRSWRGALVVVSHDLELLELMDSTAELYANDLAVFGGPYSEWRAWLDVEQDAAKQTEADARKAYAKEKHQRMAAETRLARRARYAKTDYENKRRPRTIMKNRAREAQVSAGKLRGETKHKQDEARRTLEAAERRVRDDPSMRIDLPDPGVASSRRVAEIGDGARSWIVQGPERVALTGPNGSGKTTLLQSLVYGIDPGGVSGSLYGHRPSAVAIVGGEPVSDPIPTVRAASALYTDRVGYLPQRFDGLDEAASPLEVVAAAATGTPDRELSNRLARFLIRGDAAHRPLGELSGGERFRVVLARLLLADPPPQLLILDEPTNNLDLDTAEQLLDAVRSYRGAVLIVSHDDAFLRRMAPDLVLDLRNSELTERRLDTV